MTSSKEDVFRVIGDWCGEFTGERWIPRTKASDAELCARMNGGAGDLRRHRAHIDVTVMTYISPRYNEAAVVKRINELAEVASKLITRAHIS